VKKDRTRTRFIAIDGDESPLKRRAQPSRAAGAFAERSRWIRPPAYRLGALGRDGYQRVGEADNFLLKLRKVE